MSDIPLIRANNFEPVLETLRIIGAPVDRMMADINFPAHILDIAPDSFVPEYPLWCLLEKAGRSQGIENFGYRAATQSSPNNLGEFGKLLCENSSNLYSLLRFFCQTIQQHSTDSRYWLEPAADASKEQTLFCRYGTPSLSTGRWQAEQYVVVVLIQLVRLVAGANWFPEKILFETSELEGIKQCDMFTNSRIYYGQNKTAISIPNSLLQKASPGKTPLDQLHSLELNLAPSSQSERLKAALFHFINEDKFDINSACEVVGLRPRTLQRWLSEEGMSFSKIVSQIRFEKASELLNEQDINIIDISTLLGYSDPAHFTRAFRRWSGISPQQFRKQNALCSA